MGMTEGLLGRSKKGQEFMLSALKGLPICELLLLLLFPVSLTPGHLPSRLSALGQNLLLNKTGTICVSKRPHGWEERGEC